MTILSKFNWTTDNYDGLKKAPWDKLLTVDELATVMAMLPDAAHSPQHISLLLHKTHTSIANALRRAIISDMTVRHLYVELEDIETNAKELRLEDLCDRISLIPLDQDTPLTAKFSLDIKPGNITVSQWDVVGEVEIMSEHLRPLTGDKRPFALTHRIALLQPDQFLKVKVSVREGRCDKRLIGGGKGPHTGAQCSLTCQFEYQERDHITVFRLTNKGDIDSCRVNTATMIAYATATDNKELAAYIQEEVESLHLVRLSILLVEDEAWFEAADFNVMARITRIKFTLIRNDKTNAEWPRFISSVEDESHEYYLRFSFNGNMDAKAALLHACDDLIARLNKLCDIDAAQRANFVQIDVTGQETENDEPVELHSITVRNETHTMGRILEQFMFAADPSIGLVNYNMPHPQSRRIIVNVIHPQAKKIFEDAAKAAKADIIGLREAIEKIKHN